MSDAAKPSVPGTTLAKLFNLTPVRIQQLAKLGHVVKTAHGRYDLWASVSGYIRFLQERCNGKGVSGTDYERARTRLVMAQAEDAEVKAALTKGTAHDADIIREMLADMIHRTKTRLQAVPIKAAAQLESCGTAGERKAMLEAMVNEALHELSDYDGRDIASRWAARHRRAVPADGADVEAAPGVDGEPVGGRAAEAVE